MSEAALGLKRKAPRLIRSHSERKNAATFIAASKVKVVSSDYLRTAKNSTKDTTRAVTSAVTAVSVTGVLPIALVITLNETLSKSLR